MPRRRAARGEGGVTYDRQRDDYRARYPLGVIDGRRRYLSGRAPTEDDAWDVWERLRAQAGGEPVLTDRTTVDQYMRSWLETHAPSVRPSTAATYQYHIDAHVSRLLGGLPVLRLRPEDVERLVADMLRSGKSPAYVQRVVTTLRIALGRAVRRRLLPDNAAALASLPRVEQRLVEPMTDATADRIIEALTGDPDATPPTRDHWLLPVVRVLLGTGLRVGEACGLDWRDVHEDEGYVVVRVSKTRQRVQPVTDDAADALRDLRRSRVVVDPRAPVFVRRRQGRGERAGDMRMRPQSVSHALPEALVARGLPKVTAHGLRHGYATRLVAHGVHMRLVAELLGHRDGGALAGRTYAHVVPAHLVTAAKSLDRGRRSG